jgi:arsenate reductase
MSEMGISLASHHSKHVAEYMGKVHFGYLIIVCANAEKNCPATFPGMGQRLHWAFDDPAAFEGTDEAKPQKIREIRDQIDRQIQNWIAETQTKKSEHQAITPGIL